MRARFVLASKMVHFRVKGNDTRANYPKFQFRLDIRQFTYPWVWDNYIQTVIFFTKKLTPKKINTFNVSSFPLSDKTQAWADIDW